MLTANSGRISPSFFRDRKSGLGLPAQADAESRYTSAAFIEALQQHRIAISMDGRGRALDNVFVERPWRTVKYEEIYRREYDDMCHLRGCLADYFEFYNHRRPHSSLDGQSPAAFHAASVREHQQAG